MALREQSIVHDRISVHGVLLDNKVQHLRNFVHLDDHDNRVKFTTWRPFSTGDPLDRVVKLDDELEFGIAFGQKGVEWE